MKKIILFISIFFVWLFLTAELYNLQYIKSLTPTPVKSKAGQPVKKTQRDIIVEAAKSLIGVDYWPGGQDTEYGYDCSGLTQYCYNKAGINIPRTAFTQYQAAVKIEYSEIKKGDLLFFCTFSNCPNHVGIYIGKNRFIHAPAIGKQVREESFFRPYYNERFVGAGRFIEN